METFSFDVGDKGSTTARAYRAKDPIGVTLVLAHGAGASQAHPFMIDIAARLTRRGLDVMTFDFLYMHSGRKMPDRTELLERTWRAAITSIRARSGLTKRARFFIGGKSMGGRMATHIAADPMIDLGIIKGVVLLGYPLHPPDKPKARRDAHLPRVQVPMLFVQGQKDDFGNAREMRALVKKLPSSRLHIVPAGDHSLATPKRDGGPKQQERVLEDAADAILTFVRPSKG